MPHLRAVSRRPIDPQLVESTAVYFGLEPSRLAFVRDVANVVYACDDRFLRFTHRSDHTVGQVRGEIEWIDFLVAEGLPVCRPARATDGEFVCVASDDYTAVVFERVRGREISLEEFDERIFELMGRFLGRLHRVGERFEPSDPACARPHVLEFEPYDRVLGSWAPDDLVVARAWESVFDRVHSASGEWGLIHGDVHRGNLFVHDEGIDVIDFDDSCYFFLAADIANALFYSLWFRRHDPEADRSRFARTFLRALLGGYRAERPFPTQDLALVPDLLDYRDLTVDAFSHRRRLDPDAEVRRRYEQVRARIARGAPYVDLGDALC